MPHFYSTVLMAAIWIIFLCAPPAAAENNTRWITDSLDRHIQVRCPLDRVVVVNTAVAIILRAIGVDIKQTLAGVTHYILDNPEFWPELLDKPGIRFTDPNYEVLAALDPQAVFFYKTSPRYTSQAKLESLGIPAVYLDCFDPRTLESEIELLGRLFDRQARARELILWYKNLENRIVDEIASIEPQNRPRVFYFTYPDTNLPKGIYRTANRNRSSHGVIKKAGAINIAADLSDAHSAVSAEWIMEQNPDAVVASVIGKDFSGYNADPEQSLANLKKVQEQILSDKAFRHTAAGRNKRVLVFAQDLKQGPAYVAGLAHIARFLYPEIFMHLDPDQTIREYYQRWCGLPFQGTFAYPVPAKPAGKKALSFVDSSGRQISLPLPVNRIAGLHSSAIREFCLLGIQDKVVGVTDYLKDFPGMYPGLETKPLIGSAYTPLYETILESGPELVVMSSSSANLEPVIKKLAPSGIRVAALDLNPNRGDTAFERETRYDDELRILGRITGRQARAEAFIQWKQRIINLIQTRTRGVDKKTVVGINYSGTGSLPKDYKVWAGSRIIELAGAVDAARQIPGTVVSPEWILEQDPDAIILAAYFPQQGMGYAARDTKTAAYNLNAVKTSRIFLATRAAASNRIYLFGYYGTASGGQTPIGALYLAKRLYPDRFADIDPQSFHRTYFENWLQTDYQGVWFYP
jgi:iron complex transport system substrate-binding protein